MTRPDLVSRDPFAHARRDFGLHKYTIGNDSVTMLLRLDDLKTATKDFATFSSDAPCRVPIPSEEHVRFVRQLPIETDPPLHRDYRKLVMPAFTRPNNPGYADNMRTLVDAAVAESLRTDRVEVVSRFALPLQSRALTLLLNVPIEESEEWINWGTHVFREKDEMDRDKASYVDQYIERLLDRARREPGDDFFTLLTTAEIDDRALTREEMLGFANLAFAGGRDTVINLIANSLYWLAENPDALDALRKDSGLINSATEEFIRFFSPLTHIGRVLRCDTNLHGEKVEAGSIISLCWASANRDEKYFEEPDTVRLDRHPNPHVGFGKGHHLCLGAPHARSIMRSVLQSVVRRVKRLTLLDSDPLVERFGHLERHAGYKSLTLNFQ